MFEAITTSVTTVWLIVSVMVLLLFISAVNDNFAAAFWFTVIGLALLQFFTIADPWGWLEDRKYAALIATAVYIPIGVGWSLFRWWKVLQKRANELRHEKATWKPLGAYSSWEEYVKRHLPSASANKERIVCWIAYWPFSAAAYLLIDLLTDIGEWIYAKLSGLYQAMVDRVAESLK